ncbi:glycoside hydrolase family 9 protein [Kribbella sp. NPDC005582]|uniref:glycoside hydrolase family 9 protein n=1 Tax=Kribbella sp. NPDC005582 TaxID=3156893 RepID=UPI0033AD22BE
MRALDEDMLRVLVSHLGFGSESSKAVVAVMPFPVVRATLDGGGTTIELEPQPVERVPGWSGGPYVRILLPQDLAEGKYVVRIRFEGGETTSTPFVVAPERIQRQTMSDVLAYFKAMRSSGEIDRKDRAAKFWGDDSGATVDARGGWLDASGDTSKFLSHLTYTSTMSPQQIPLCAWAMLAARDELIEHHPGLVRMLSARLRDESLWGADFLMRFRSPEGYFYTGIFDALTKELEERVVTAPLQNSVRTSRYQAGYRQGGGLAIAALARASTVDDDGDFTRAEYLQAAQAGFEHLEKHNLEYLFDGTESVLDDYTALLAATELVVAEGGGAKEGEGSAAPSVSGQSAASQAARRRAASLIARYVQPDDGPGWFRADEADRPFFHAAEPGLPVLALLRFADVFDDAAARETALRAMLDIVRRTDAVPNPFGYPRTLVQPLGEEPRESFFFPHANETGYWWQGENAAIASLSAAASACARVAALPADLRGFADLPPGTYDRLITFADDQLAWITGRNPFDTCMLQGRGRNNPDYASDFPNFPGGIVNGITAGFTDEQDIAFLPSDAPDGDEWRWAEQWIPHTAWFLLATASAR